MIQRFDEDIARKSAGAKALLKVADAVTKSYDQSNLKMITDESKNDQSKKDHINESSLSKTARNTNR